MSPAFIGAVVNSALYLAGCFAAGLMLGNPWAWKAALAAMGVAFLSYVCHELRPGFMAGAVALSSWALGILAGLALLFT